MKSVTATQERLGMRSGCHAAKILPVGDCDTKNVWSLSSLIAAPYVRFRTRDSRKHTRRVIKTIILFLVKTN